MDISRENMHTCDHKYNAIFKRFKVIEFPTSFVGLSTDQELDVEADLTTSAYLKTMCENNLMKFKDAREISAPHRAFNLLQINSHTLKIIFKPLSECVSKAMKYRKQYDNRFVFDLRLIELDGIRCCDDEAHAEVGRYFISGQYEYCKITHNPKVINFGDIIMSHKVVKHVRIRNDSKFIAAKMSYVRLTGFQVSPSKFTIPPNSSKRLTVVITATSLKMGNILVFKIRNPYDMFDDTAANEKSQTDTNFITYTISTELHVIYERKLIPKEIESIHKLYDQNPLYTYIGKEIDLHNKRKNVGLKLLEDSKSAHVKKPVIIKNTGKEICYSDTSFLKVKNTGLDFCKKYRNYLSTYDIFSVLLMPPLIKFGEIAMETFGEHDLVIKNNSKYDVVIKLLDDDCIVYTNEKLHHLRLLVKSFSDITVTIFCNGYVAGAYKGTFEYTIDNRYRLKHPYKLQVGNPELMVHEPNLKFGMVTNESFVTSCPVKIYNHFNVPIPFTWLEMTPDTPFEIIPNSGIIPKRSCKICDIIYICKSTKTKTHEIDLISKGTNTIHIPLEVNVITRKLSIKFLQPAVLFKDIPLNLETVEIIKLENSSREIALFYIVEPLIPGIRVEPMSGILRPKTILTFDIIVKISCVMEFAFDICVKINNKENVSLPISGNVIEPKLTMHPKNIYMPRVPCGMITYIPVTIQNLSTLKSTIQVLDTGDDNIFNVYIAQGNEKQRVFEFTIDGGQSKMVFIKVYDIFRREYEMYIPFKINGLLGPPDDNSGSTELHYYIGQYEELYENNVRAKIKNVNKDISYCRIAGVITVPWIKFSVENFEINYEPNGENCINFTMTNISKYHLHVTILTNKLAPYFTLNILTETNLSIINEANIKFELDRGEHAELKLLFHPKAHGRFVSVATLYLDRYLTLPYSNLTFVGKRQTPLMTPSTHRMVLPPCLVETEITRLLTLKMEGQTNLESFNCSSKQEPNLRVSFIDCEVVQEDDKYYTIVTVSISICCRCTYARNLNLGFHHERGSSCDVEVNFCSTYCPLTLHTERVVKPEDNPYPYYPLPSQTELYEYLETCCQFLERWMFQQGFRRDLYPIIPDTFLAISSSISSSVGVKTKGVNVSYLSFVRRIAGPLMKHIRKITVQGHDESFKYVKEIHDTYREIINLLNARGANLWVLQPKFLLSYEQFVIYSENVASKGNADILLVQELLEDADLFNRLNKQSWIDFILQSYKVFILDSCFFDCVCVSSLPRDIVKVLIDWYNEQIAIAHHILRKNKPVKVITNITTDLSDGIAVISTFLNYCPFMQEHFSLFCEIDDDVDVEGAIINNTCLIIETMNYLKLYFPLISKEFLRPNFLQMLFLSIHLYVTLPSFKTKETIKFNPPLLRSSSRILSIFPSSQETLTFTHLILNNSGNSFLVEKSTSNENGKKMFLNVKYFANFVDKSECLLLIHGYNKTRIFDTYIIFELCGQVGALNPVKKCKLTAPLYRPIKVDVQISSPFQVAANFQVSITDIEPTVPVNFEERPESRFYVRRLNLIDEDISLSAMPKDSGPEVLDHKLYLQMICLSSQIGNSWIWFRSEIGEFFIKVVTQARWDLALDTLQAKVETFPMDPCSCGEACECYRTTVLSIPHQNELMVKSLRFALLENASFDMMKIFDELIETPTGKIILGMLLTEGGTNMSEVTHILRNQNSYRITSRALLPRLDRVTLYQHSDAVLALPVTIPPNDKAEKYSVTFTSECGMDIRTYRVLFIPVSNINTRYSS